MIEPRTPHRPTTQWIKRSLWVIVALGILMAVAVVMRSNGPRARAINEAALISATKAYSGRVVVTIMQPAMVIHHQAIPLAASSSGSISQVLVHEGQFVKGGQPLVIMENPTVTEQLVQAQENLSLDQAKLQQAESPLSPSQAAANQQALVAAQKNIALTQRTLTEVRSSSSPTSVAVVNAQKALAFAESPSSPDQAAIVNAENAVSSAQSNLKQAAAMGNTSQMAQARAELSTAQAALGSAKAALAQTILQGKNALALAEANQASAAQSAQNAVTSSQMNWEKIQSSNTVGQPTPSQMATLKSQVTMAQSAVAAAQTTVQALTIRSPIDGIVTQLNANVGQTANPTVPFMTILGRSLQLTVNIPVSLADSDPLYVGETVQATAANGQHAAAVINTIAPSAATLALDQLILTLPSSGTFQAGQTVSVTLPLQTARGVVVPNAALISQSQSRGTVDVVRGRALFPTTVKIVLHGANTSVVGSLRQGTLVANPANGAFTQDMPIRIAQAQK